MSIDSLQRKIAVLGLLIALSLPAAAQQTTVSTETMKAIYEEVKTPYKYGVAIHKDAELSRSVDCPTVFRGKANTSAWPRRRTCATGGVTNTTP